MGPMHGPKPDTSSVSQPEPAFPELFGRYIPPLSPPRPFDALTCLVCCCAGGRAGMLSPEGRAMLNWGLGARDAVANNARIAPVFPCLRRGPRPRLLHAVCPEADPRAGSRLDGRKPPGYSAGRAEDAAGTARNQHHVETMRCSCPHFRSMIGEIWAARSEQTGKPKNYSHLRRPLVRLFYRSFAVNGGPRRIRTPDPLIRSQVLYPAELSVRPGSI